MLSRMTTMATINTDPVSEFRQILEAAGLNPVLTAESMEG